MSAHGMATQGLAGEIVAAVVADEADGGCDISAGLFGPAFSALIRRLAADHLAGLSRRYIKLHHLTGVNRDLSEYERGHRDGWNDARLCARTPAEQPEQDVNGA